MNAYLAAAVSLSLAATALGWPSPGHATEDYDNCTGYVDSLPATIGSQGTWCLRHNLGTAITSGKAITITANNVTLDCNDFKLGGLAAGSGTKARAIYASGRNNLKVRNCNIRGFSTGIDIYGGGGHVIERNLFNGNTAKGVRVLASSGSTIRDNAIVDTGGSSTHGWFAAGIHTQGGVDVIDNTVTGVVASDADGKNYGIYVGNVGDTAVLGNRVSGLTYSAEREAVGIQVHDWYDGPNRTVIRDNVVIGPGTFGIRCVGRVGTSTFNTIAGFDTSLGGCMSLLDMLNAN